MIKLKVIAISASKKSALCAALLTDGVFTTEVAIGNIRVSEELSIGSIHQTNFKTCTLHSTTTEPDSDGVVKTFNWLVLGL